MLGFLLHARVFCVVKRCYVYHLPVLAGNLAPFLDQLGCALPDLQAQGAVEVQGPHACQ